MKLRPELATAGGGAVGLWTCNAGSNQQRTLG